MGGGNVCVVDLFGWRECMCSVWVGMYVLGLGGECKLWVWMDDGWEICVGWGNGCLGLVGGMFIMGLFGGNVCCGFCLGGANVFYI